MQKTSIKYIKIILLSFISIFLIDCNNGKLTRENAEKIIKSKNKFPIEEFREIKLMHANSGSNTYLIPLYQKLAEAGLITYEVPAKDVYGFGGPPKATLTPKGMEYAVGNAQRSAWLITQKVIVDKLVFGEVTGILEKNESNEAEVTYTLVRKDISPFGLVAFNLSEESVTNTIILRKFDDGWR